MGTVANSTSTMHTLQTTPITWECFETDDFEDLVVAKEDIENYEDEFFFDHWHTGFYSENEIEQLEQLRRSYLITGDVRYWKELIRWLPESWLQTRTITLNYENLYAMVHQRGGHKLTEWSVQFMNFVKSLPYAKDLIFSDSYLNKV